MFSRYVAIGDSQTEGLNDPDGHGGFRGWADRLAEQLAAVNPELHYANLAVRGKKAPQVRAEQLEAALALEPDLVTCVAGMNDVLRPGADIGATVRELEAMFVALREAGATVVTCTFPDVGLVMPLARGLRPRVFALNDAIREVAPRHEVLVVDCAPYPAICDERYWSPDRLHASPLGHAGIAAAFADTLGVPGSNSDWQRPLPAMPPRSLPRRIGREARWAAVHLTPWLMRRATGRSSGDGVTAKRPELLPVAVV